jgi:hypothetical protein
MDKLRRWFLDHEAKLRGYQLAVLIFSSIGVAIEVYQGTFHWFDMTFWLFILAFVLWVTGEITWGE